MNDNYPTPFEWANEFEMPLVDLIGLLPCMCEAGWLPLVNGDYIACSACSEVAT